jgi:hypothetical protein
MSSFSPLTAIKVRLASSSDGRGFEGRTLWQKDVAPAT